MKSFLRGTTEQARPSDDVFAAPQWSVSGITRKTEYNQTDVRDVVSRLKVRTEQTMAQYCFKNGFVEGISFLQ